MEARMSDKNLFYRNEYIQKLEKWSNSPDLVKIITGVRRCGKSKLLEIFQNKLLEEKKISKDQIISINLEDQIIAQKIGLSLNKDAFLDNFETLLKYVIDKIQPNKINYVFIDEIQLLNNWQQVANTLRLQNNVDVYLTGSNAYMFSSDLSNFFGGRYVEIKMQPYSFTEYYGAYILANENNGKSRQEVLTKDSINDIYLKYIQNSGFPQTVNLLWDRQMIEDYLRDVVYNNTLQKDIIKRFNIKNSQNLESVILYLFDNIGSETSLRGIENALKNAGIKVSVPDISKYIKGLLDSYLLYECKRYNIKGKQILNGNSKYFVADLGLRKTLLVNKKNDVDKGHILENLVYLELLRRGYKVSFGHIYKYFVNELGKKDRVALEVDFVAQKEGVIEYYQVAYNAFTEKGNILDREIEPLKRIGDNYPKYILSMDLGNEDMNGIKRQNVLDWLMEFKM
jgi:predicted AAA+ superfamily ATPase